MTWIIFIVIGLIALFIVNAQKQTKKRQEWFDNYKLVIKEHLSLSEDEAKEIFKGNHWLGMDALKFLAIFGLPDHTEVVEMKTKTKELLHYNVINPNTKRATSNKYTFENSLLVKTDVKANQETVWQKSNLINPISGLNIELWKSKINELHPSLYQ